jgi:hypothetical protein
MFRFIDRSRFLSRFIDNLSNLAARQRGLPVVAGIVFVILAFVIQMLNVTADSIALEYIGLILLYLGLLTSLIGLLLAAPLGK